MFCFMKKLRRATISGCCDLNLDAEPQAIRTNTFRCSDLVI